jgi:hypothetical protein
MSAKQVVPVERIELPTFGLQNRCSTAELNRQIGGEGPQSIVFRRWRPVICHEPRGGQIAELSAKGHQAWPSSRPYSR